MMDRTYRVEFDEQRIDSIFAELNQCHQPGAAVGIAIGGRPVYRKGFGLASIELPLMLSPAMRMRLGSTSKHFTAFACMLLCEEGKARCDDPLVKYLPELHPVTHQVTLRQLMTNVSNLRDATDVSQQFSGAEGRTVTTDDLLSLYRDMNDANAAPGTTYMYNNGGWILLSVALERMTGQPFEQLMWERVFEPVGMYDTMIRRWEHGFVPNSARTHATNARGQYEKVEYCGGIDYAGAGAIVSTVDDMLRWATHMDAPRVGSASTWEAMKKPHTLANGTSTGYALGLFADRYRGADILHHGGGGLGSNAQMLKVPRAGLDVVVLVNRADVMGVHFVERILDACLPGLDPVETRSSGPQANGLFLSAQTGRVIQLYESGGRQFASVNGWDAPVESSAHGVLKPPLVYGNWSITLVGERQAPTAIRFDDVGNPDDLASVRSVGDGAAEPISGRYRSSSTGTEITISASSDRGTLTAVGRFGSAIHHLERLGANLWRTRAASEWIRPLSAVLVFDSAGFRFSNAMNRALPFERIG
jgi:D-aminopeptidase